MSSLYTHILCSNIITTALITSVMTSNNPVQWGEVNSIFNMYFCKGNISWFEEINDNLLFSRFLLQLTAITLCENYPQKTVQNFIRALRERAKEMKNNTTDNDDKANNSCFQRAAIVALKRGLCCDGTAPFLAKLVALFQTSSNLEWIKYLSRIEILENIQTFLNVMKVCRMCNRKEYSSSKYRRKRFYDTLSIRWMIMGLKHIGLSNIPLHQGEGYSIRAIFFIFEGVIRCGNRQNGKNRH